MLSNGPKEILTTVQALLEITEAIQFLDDKKLKELIKMANDLPPEEAARAEKARKDIADNQALVLQQRKNIETIALESSKISENLALLEQTRQRLNSQAQALGVREKELEDSQIQLKQDQLTLELAQKKLAKENAEVLQRAKELSDKADQLAEIEKAQKSKDEQLKAIVGG